MTEELKQEAEESAKKFFGKPTDLVDLDNLRIFKNGYLAGAEPREKRNEELEMTVGALRTFSNEQATCIERLEAQIEKMKCCENCAWWYRLPNGQKDCAEKCENLDNWSLRR